MNRLERVRRYESGVISVIAEMWQREERERVNGVRRKFEYH